MASTIECNPMESLEEGQIIHDDGEPLHAGYDPEYEWPGDPIPEHETETYSRSTQALRAGQPIFRLVVLRSSILSKQKKVAVIDSYPEAQLGRDVQVEGSAVPRIRLKEMQVSKVHATLFWDSARKEWDVVDMGSMHGTFLLPGPVNPDGNGLGSRLSLSRTASIPRRLRHSDQLTLGSTTFEIHIHDNQRPCLECSVTGQEEIPLFPLPKKTSVKRTRDIAEIDSDGSASSTGSINTEKDPKKALSMLKRSLLTQHDNSQHGSTSTVAATKTNEYVDRAARRRLLHPSSRPDTPGVPGTPPAFSQTTPSSASGWEKQRPELIIASQPPAPLPSSNIGHRLLMQQGWEPGNSLGTGEDLSDGRTALVDPLELKTSQNRTGLGMKRVEPSLSDSGLSWKDREKFKRFGK